MDALNEPYYCLGETGGVLYVQCDQSSALWAVGHQVTKCVQTAWLSLSTVRARQQ